MAMTKAMFLSIGECMIEMMPLEDGHFRFGVAGDTLNTAWYVRALLPKDMWSVSYMTRLGNDPYSEKIRKFLTENSIETGFITTDEKRRPGLYLIEVENGERSFTYWREASAARGLADDEAHLMTALDAASTIYFSGITLAILQPDRRHFLIDAIGRARKAGKMTIFDPNIRPRLWENGHTMRQTLEAAASVTAISLPSFDDEAEIFKDQSPEACVKRYLNYGCDTVVVKNGGGPIWYGSDGKTKGIEGYEKIKPIDTTGAGDAFNGAFLASYAANGSVEEAIQAGHSTAQQVILHRGALMPMETIIGSAVI